MTQSRLALHLRFFTPDDIVAPNFFIHKTTKLNRACVVVYLFILCTLQQHQDKLFLKADATGRKRSYRSGWVFYAQLQYHSGLL